MKKPQKLYDWLLDLKQDFGDETPDPDKLDNILSEIKKETSAYPVKYLGKGDNGIAFKTNIGTVLKFTLDEQESLLWSQVVGDTIAGLALLHNVFHLSDKEKGNTSMYVIHVAFIPSDLSDNQSKLLNQTILIASGINTENARAQLGPNPLTPEQFYKQRTLTFIDQFEKAAKRDDSFQLVATMLKKVADRYQSHLIDLKSDNFKVDDAGNLILIDPSVPNIYNNNTNANKPTILMFEDKINLALNTMIIKY